MPDENVIVSVICLAYNHGKFIKDTLDGFINQNIGYPVEYIIHDDCSTDNTRQIIDEYAVKYPHLIMPFYEDTNQYSQNIGLFRLVANRAKGKYIAICEGDDYWCDQNKLSIQVTYMEKHPECSLFLHNGYIFDNQTKDKRPLNPYEHEGLVSIHDIMIEKHLPPTASMMCRRVDLISQPEEVFGNTAGVEDRPLRLYLCTKGRVYYSNRNMCVYRTNTQTSFSKKSENEKGARRVLDGMIPVYKRYDDYTDGKYHNDVNMMISREWYLYYLRTKSYGKCVFNKYFLRYIPFRQKMGTLKKAFTSRSQV